MRDLASRSSRKLFLFNLVLTFAAASALAVAAERPVSFDRQGLAPLESLRSWSAPPVDVQRLRSEDLANQSRGDVPFRIGYPMATDLSPGNSGSWAALDRGDRLWRLTVRSQGALWVVLGFDTYRLQGGAKLWIYDEAGRMVLGPFTTADHRDHGELWTPPIEGDAVVVELYWPARLANEEPRIHLGTVSHGYRPFGTIGRAAAAAQTEGIGDSGACNIDVACPLGVNWQDEKRGVVILLSGGEGFCSGSLINTTADDCRPYVLTAAHCSAGTSTVFGFNFERTGCGTGNPGPPTTYTVAGATRLANYSYTDFTLLQMSASPPESFNVYYNGWSRESTPATHSWPIHHPQGDVKKISHDDDPATNGTYYNADHWRVENYEEGTTEPGSSGSPLFDQNSRIVGQLHGGTASCTSITFDEYGKIAASWAGGGTPATRLSDWLDPEGTGALVMDGVDWSTCAFNPAGTVELNRSRYTCSDTLAISLRDDSLRGNPTQTVTVSSETEPAGETVILSAIEPGSGRFTGTLSISPVTPSNGDGLLSVSHADTVTVTYIDADDGQGGVNVVVTTTADVDCIGPEITFVQAVNVTGNSADVTFVTNEPANSVVHYGTSIPPGLLALGNALVTSHTVALRNLSGCTAYLFSVQVSDAAGNTTSDNNGGLYYGFITSSNVTPTYVSPDPPIAIPDSTPAGVTMTITVPDAKTVMDVNVRINITHTYDGDLDIYLIGPNGTQVELSTDNGGTGENFIGTVFDDEAPTSVTAGAAPFTGSFKPEGLLSVLDGIPANGVWTLKVIDDAGIDVGTLQSFELIFEFPPEPCPTVGQVTLDQAAYNCTETVGIQAVDFSILGAGTQAVTIQSTSETTPESLLLTETPPNSGTFVGSIPLTTVIPSNGDGLLSIADGDTISVLYIDADDGYGNTNVPRTDTANVDCAAPVISAVQAVNITGSTAEILYATNEPATSVVAYGPTTPPAASVSDSDLLTDHSVLLTGLIPCSTYYFSVSGTDVAGNSSTADNGGAYFAFSTGAIDQFSVTASGLPASIPDNDVSGLSATIVVPEYAVVADVNVRLSATHPNDADLDIYLIGPDGTQVELSTDNGSAGDNYTNTVFDDEAATTIAAGAAPFTGSFRPETPLSALDGIVATGTWTLKVVDDTSTSTGSLGSFELILTYAPRPCAPLLMHQSHSFTDACSGGGGGAGNTFADPGEFLTIPVALINAGTTNATGISATLSALTPGVVVTSGASAYPDLVPGASAGGTSPFVVFVGDTVACETTLSLRVDAVSAEGVWSDTFPIPMGSPAQATFDIASTDVPKPIQDYTTSTSSIYVATTETVLDVNVTINISHSYDGDVDVFLVGPNGTRVELTTDNGSSGDNYTNTVFNDEAVTSVTVGVAPFTGSYRPEGPLSALDGILASGTWTLEVYDDAGGDTGTLDSWSLTLTTTAAPNCVTCSAAIPPFEVESLGWTSGKNTLGWSSALLATSYNVYRGEYADLPNLMNANPDSCSRLTTADLTSGPVLTEVPGPNGLHWFLVRGQNGYGLGPAGNATTGPRVQNSSGACP